MDFYRDKVDVITDSTGGLGQILTRKLADAGALFIVTGRTAEAVHGRVDVLVNNAGIGFARVEEATDDRQRGRLRLDPPCR